MTGKRKEAYIKGFSRRDYIQKAHELIQREGVKAISKIGRASCRERV